ncbi:MAG TPA: S46 family peptidase, partial [Polyangiaceae bacterium]|nr:S46 family peptidase [Polyangiaceae bacterium]
MLRSLLAALVCAALLCGGRAHSDEGMWPFHHLPRAALQRKYGFVASDAWLTHVQRSSLRVGGGSGSFVSGRGLLLTNHHCVEDCISRLSSRARDYQKLGFYAETADEELACPGLSIQQLTEITDVTARLSALTQGLAGAAFQQALRAEKARLEQECRTDPEASCELVSLYHGAVYELYRYRRYADVRLVFAPERDAALFGGDPDNFSFPRYDLDLAFLRVYTGGAPALTPDHLAWSRSGLAPNELIFVSGNPGSTDRLRTVSELEFLRDRALVTELLLLAQYRGFLNEYAARGPEAKRAASSEIYRVENTYKELGGARETLASRSFFAGVVEREAELRARVASRPSWQARYGGAWDA